MPRKSKGNRRLLVPRVLEGIDGFVCGRFCMEQEGVLMPQKPKGIDCLVMPRILNGIGNFKGYKNY